MRRTECPGCGKDTGLSMYGALPNHTLDGMPVSAVLSPLCWLSCVELEEARALMKIIEEGGERLRLAAHP